MLFNLAALDLKNYARRSIKLSTVLGLSLTFTVTYLATPGSWAFGGVNLHNMPLEAIAVGSAGAAAEAVFVGQNPPEISWGTNLSAPRAVILCIHGLGLHKGTFAEFGKKMAQSNIAVHAIDIRGFGDWHLKGQNKLNMPESMADIKRVLVQIHSKYPNATVFILGESMGGAIALQAAAAYPNLIAGLISSVPSGDRWSGLGEDLHVGMHVLLGGFKTKFNVGQHVAAHATAKAELQSRWDNDPACRADFSPEELLTFQTFMNKNNEAANAIKSMPVLIIQGAQDKLVRPGGTFNVWEHLGTADRQVVVSKTAEHLIFEFGQFNDDDINFVTAWLGKAMSPTTDSSASTVDTTPIKPSKPATPSADEILAGAPHVMATPPTTIAPPNVVVTTVSMNGLPSLSYWIELMRGGQRFRCNNKTSFKSGDEIRIHITANQPGYAYILMKQGTSGAHAVLFPEARTGQNNRIDSQKDYVLPSATWLKFDDHPGTEKVSLVFSPSALDSDTNRYLNNRNLVISSDRTGAKDLCPTRMQISWDDPNPMIIPPDAGAVPASNSSVVRVSSKDTSSSLVALDIDLEHQK